MNLEVFWGLVMGCESYLSSRQGAATDPRVMSAFIGDSLPMKMLYKKLKQVSRSDAPVFISGESGTGKELCASVLHKYGKRHQGPFIAVNCAAIPSELFESQLFGHLRGAFTGASCDRDGYTMAADGGTLFLNQ